MDYRTWPTYSLREVGTIVTGSTPSTKDPENYSFEDYCFIKPSDISNSGISVINDSEYHISRKAFSQSRRLPAGSVLTTCIGIIGKVGILQKEATCNQQINALIPNKGFDSSFLAYAILSKKIELQEIANAPVVPIINKKTFSELRLRIPELPVQLSIAKELNLLADIIDKKNAQLRDLDILVDSLFYEMFGEAEVNQKGFPLLTVDDVIQFQGGSQPDKKFFEYEPTEDNVRLIQIRDYKTDRYITYVPKELARRFCTEDDIMIGRYGPPIFQILKGISGAYNVALMKAVPKQGNKDFIRVFLKQKRLLHYLESFSRRVAGQDGIQMDKLKAYPFPFPPMELQNRFAKQYHEIEKQKLVVSQSMAECESLLSSRMSHYFD